jgi:hypothetical protein
MSTSLNMADVHSPFRYSQTPHKRKRQCEDQTDSSFNRDSKRRSIHTLPIRLTPPRLQLAGSSAYPLFTSVYEQPPTPVDTSEDESPSHLRDRRRWHTDSSTDQRRHEQNTPPLTAQEPESVDVDMDMCSPILSQPKMRRARSNDIIAPQRDANLSSAMASFARDRVPTPISGRFDNRIANLPDTPRHQFPPLRTNLSPMVEQECWFARDTLPSPVEDADMDGMVMDGQASQASKESMNAQQARHAGLRHSGRASPGTGRTARLHMGFLTGCEKCIQKVPGHYSHILWS